VIIWVCILHCVQVCWWGRLQ